VSPCIGYKYGSVGIIPDVELWTRPRKGRTQNIFYSGIKTRCSIGAIGIYSNSKFRTLTHNEISYVSPNAGFGPGAIAVYRTALGGRRTAVSARPDSGDISVTSPTAGMAGSTKITGA
jgi:hypothetical protein